MNNKTSILVRFDQVGKSYDGKTLAVENLNLEIERGEFLTLLGPSGSGKSTTLMMLAGFESPTQGQIFFDNQPLDSIPAHRRNFGLVFQNYALFPHMTVLENVAYPQLLRKLNRIDAESDAKRALEMVQLKGFDDRKPSQLSGGQQQRVALARALVYQPRIVLLDEPLGALDKKLRDQMQIELKRIHQSLGVTFVFVTHDQDEALTMSNRIAVFNEGSIQQIADPTTLYEQPENPFVATFIGETNMLKAVVKSRIDNDTVRVCLRDNSLMVAKATGVLNKDDAVALSVRPENISLAEGNNQLAARWQDTIYHGAYASVLFTLRNKEQIYVRMSASNIERLDRYKDCSLTIETKHLTAFKL